MLFRLWLLAVLSSTIQALGRFQDEEQKENIQAAHFQHHFRPEPMSGLPGMVARNHQAGPPGFAPSVDIIRAMRREHRADVAIGRSKKHPHLVGFSRRRLHKAHAQ